MGKIDRILMLADLPTPPPDKAGWPWTEQSERVSDQMFDGSKYPLISIVTPSYNQGQFIEETIRSVLLQGYPNLEYIIIDGASTDNTIEILKKYNSFITHWVSEPDRGQSHAINKGLAKISGQLVGWQNSDDFYEKKAFYLAAETFLKDQTVGVIYGNVNQIDHASNFSCKRKVLQFSLEAMLPGQCVYNQSMFFNKSIFESGVFLRESRVYLMDFNLFWDIALQGFSFIFVADMIGNLRYHNHTKTSNISHVMTSDFFEIYKDLYSDPRFPKSLHRKLKESMKGACLDSFGKLQLNTFRQHAQEIYKLFGIEPLLPQILIKYFFSYFGVHTISSLRKIRNQVMIANEQRG